MSEPVGPLDGTLVLEVANWIAGPCCGALLADAGATVRPCLPLRYTCLCYPCMSLRLCSVQTPQTPLMRARILHCR